MKKEFNSKFEIKLDFERETENPSRLFRSFAEMIEGINDLDYLIAESVNTSVKSKIILDDIEKGSIIGRFWNALVMSQDGQIDNAPDNEKIEEYIEESRAETLKFIADKKSSVEDLYNLKTTISEIANEKELTETFNYAEPDLLKLAKSINSINDSTVNLNENETFELKSENKEVKEIGSGTSKIDIEAVEEALTESEIVNESEMFYLIKKPDFLGDSAWSFKHGTKSVTVKILHQEWLDEFHSGKVPVAPGDSLNVLVRQTSKYNRNGYCISDKLEIIEVINVIHNN
jgi:hypothetical protein|tara:strand:+ start:111 stop:974 length:864 start_codon:yes stop_codon:yes gene_type:complete